MATVFVNTACDQLPPEFKLFEATEEVADATEAAPEAQTTKLVERDVEAPDVFQATEAALWDGRPSLGGVWVAHPDVAEPERVIIRNQENGRFVVGALFRRERVAPGPRIQTSSDAAAELGILAGAPVELSVTALRREAVPEPVPEHVPSVAPEPDAADPPAAIASAKLDPITIAGAASEDDPETEAPVAALPEDTVAETAEEVARAERLPPTPPPARPVGAALTRPYIQIGIFSVEKNAFRAVDMVQSAGLEPTVFEQSINGKPFWRVVVGPAETEAQRARMIEAAQAVGFSDAYAVSN